VRTVATQFQSEFFETKLYKDEIRVWRQDWKGSESLTGVLKMSLEEIQDLMVFLSELGKHASHQK